MTTVITTTQGDTSPQETITVKRLDGSAVVLTSATVNFFIQNPNTQQITNTGSSICAITDATNGIISYNWTPGGTDTPVVGIYNAWLVVTFPSSRPETYPFLLEVAPSPTSSASQVTF